MEVYRNPMEKIINKMEGDSIITNPRGRGRTYLRKVLFLSAWWWDRLRHPWSHVKRRWTEQVKR